MSKQAQSFSLGLILLLTCSTFLLASTQADARVSPRDDRWTLSAAQLLAMSAIDQGNAEPLEQPIATPTGPTGPETYIEAGVDNATPFVGQQITYRLRIYQATSSPGQPRLDWPSFSGFWSEDLAAHQVFEKGAAGQIYRVTEARQALFPDAPGRVTIQPAAVMVPRGQLGSGVTLESEAISVDVRPLPPGAPEGYAGAIGQFQIEARLDVKEVRVGEPLKLVVRVWGTGNLSWLPDPTDGIHTLLSKWKVYDPGISLTLSHDDTIRGEKSFERLLLPTATSASAIPAIRLIYFDPYAEAYTLVETDPLQVQILPAENAPEIDATDAATTVSGTVLNSDTPDIEAAPMPRPTRRIALPKEPLYWLSWLVLASALLGAWAWVRRHGRLARGGVHTAAQRAHDLASKRLAQAGRLAPGDADAAYAAIQNALSQYLSDKLTLSPLDITRDSVGPALSAHNVPSDLIDRALVCMDRAIAGRFAPPGVRRDAERLIDDVQAIINALDRIICAP